MAFPTIATPDNSFIRASGFKSVYARPSGGLYQTLGAIKDGELEFKNADDMTDEGKNVSHAVLFTAKCKMLQASLTEIELLDVITDGTNAFLFKLSDAAAIPTVGAAATEGWVVLSAAQVGSPKAKIVADGTPANNRYIELEWKGSLLLSELDAAVKASIDDDDFEATGGSGTLKTTGTYTAAKNGGLPTLANIKPCGITSVTLTNTGGTPQTLGPVKNVKIAFDYLAEEDSNGRYLTHAVDINIEYDWMQSDAVNLLLLNSMVNDEIDAVITMRDGLIITLSNVVGITTNFKVPTGGFQNQRGVTFTHRGKVLKSAIDGIFSV